MKRNILLINACVRDLASMFYGIPEAVLFSAELLDVEGMDTAGILEKAEAQIEDYFRLG